MDRASQRVRLVGLALTISSAGALGACAGGSRCDSAQPLTVEVLVTAGVQASFCHGEWADWHLPGYAPPWIPAEVISTPPGTYSSDGCSYWTPDAGAVGQVAEFVMQLGDRSCPHNVRRVVATVIAPPVVRRFEVLTPDIRPGESATVVADFDGEAEWALDLPDGLGSIPLGPLVSGVAASTPALGAVERITQQIRLSVRNGAGTVFTYFAGVNVWSRPGLSLMASPTSVYQGDSVNLTWTGSHATTFELAPAVGRVDAAGWVTVTPAQTTTYELRGSNPLGDEATVAATVFVTPLPRVLSVVATPNPVGLFGSPTFTSTVAHAELVAVCRYDTPQTNSAWCRSHPFRRVGDTLEFEGSIQDGTVTYEVVAWSRNGEREARARVVVPVRGPATFAPGPTSQTSRPLGPAMTLRSTGEVLLAGGGSATLELLDPDTLSPLETFPLRRAWERASAAELPDGRVLVAGSLAGTTPTAPLELVDLATRTSALVGPPLPPSARTPFIFPLEDGSAVLVGLGSAAVRYVPGTEELLDVGGGPYFGLTRACRLADGTILAAGGGHFLTLDPATQESFRLAGTYPWTYSSQYETSEPTALVCLSGGGALVIHLKTYQVFPETRRYSMAYLLDPIAATGVQLEPGVGACTGGAIELVDGRLLVIDGQADWGVDPDSEEFSMALLGDAGSVRSVVQPLSTPGGVSTSRFETPRVARATTLLRLADGRVLIHGPGSDLGAPWPEVFTPP